MKELIKLVIPKKVLNKIKYTCEKIHNEEWSGVLFYKTTGTIKSPKTFKITVEDFLLMDKGSVAYTEYETNSDVTDFIMANPNIMNCTIGHIHSHNNMKVYFSGEDMSELNENSPNFNYYLSLIVNNKMEMTAKVAFVGKDKAIKLCYMAVDENENEYCIERTTSSKSKLFIYDCDISKPEIKIDVEDFFKNRLDKILEEAKQKELLKVIQNTKQLPSPNLNYFNNIPKHVNNPNTDINLQAFGCYLLTLGSKKDMTGNIIKGMNYLRESPTRNDIHNSILKEYKSLFCKFHGIFEPEMNGYISDLIKVIELFDFNSKNYPILSKISKKLNLYLEELIKQTNNQSIKNINYGGSW